MQMQQSLEKCRPIVRPLRKYFACSRLLLVTSQASASVTTVPHMANVHPCVCACVLMEKSSTNSKSRLTDGSGPVRRDPSQTMIRPVVSHANARRRRRRRLENKGFYGSVIWETYRPGAISPPTPITPTLHNFTYS